MPVAIVGFAPRKTFKKFIVIESRGFANHEQKTPDFLLKQNNSRQYPHAHKLPQNNGEQFHTQGFYYQVEQINRKKPNKYFKRNAAG